MTSPATHEPSMMGPASSLRPELDERDSPVRGLRWLISLRWLFVAAAVTALLCERSMRSGTAEARPMALWLVVFALAGVNLGWTVLVRWISREPPLIWRGGWRLLPDAQIAVDLLGLTLILRYAGGVDSPLAIFYVFHMAISALLLPQWRAIAEGAWAALLFAGMAAGDGFGWLQPRFPFDLLSPRPESHDQAGHLVAMVAIATCGIIGTLYFTLHIAGWLRARERELAETNAALRRSQQAVAGLHARRARFMQTAAHQLKGPLATIQTLAGIVRDGLPVGSAEASTCDRIVRRCREAIHQVDELLTLARVRDADPARHRGAVADVAEVVRSVCRSYEAVAHAGRVELKFEAGPDRNLRARVQATDLRDCVANVVENAIKYTRPEGWVSVRVEPGGTGKPGEWVAVQVTDSGMGMEPAEIEALTGPRGSDFDDFRRGSNAVAAGISGTGLGLTIVREVLEKCGGRMSVSSQPGRGTGFTLLLPGAWSSDLAPAREPHRAAGPSNGPAVRKGATLCLIV